MPQTSPMKWSILIILTTALIKMIQTTKMTKPAKAKEYSKTKKMKTLKWFW